MMVRKSIKILLALIVFLLFGVSGANASVSHDHHEEISVSPFSGNAENVAPHCPLNKRHLNGQVCPHRDARDNKKEVRIAADCGGNPNAAVPVPLSFSKNNILFSVNFILPVLKRAENIFVSPIIFQHFHSDRIDHPPQS
jgi:hypothetical protein